MISDADMERMGEIAEMLLETTPHQVPLLGHQVQIVKDLELPTRDTFRAYLYLALVACRAQHPQLPDVEFWNDAIKQFQVAAAWMAQDLKHPTTVH